MDRRGRLDRVRRYLILIVIGLVAIWRSTVPVDAPLYSKSTDLPIFHTSDGLPIFGDPANCGCCGGGGPQFDSACANCPPGKTPLTMQIVLSGLTACPDCFTQLWWGPGRFRITSVPNGVFALDRDPVNPCKYTATTTYSCDTWNDYTGCNDPPDGSATPTVHITLLRKNATTWELEIWGERPGGPTPGLYMFYGTVEAACDGQWVINNIWPATSCGESIPQNTHIAHSGSATGQPI